MRSIVLLFFILPVLAPAQINRSAKELAGETIGAYITGKLFKNQSYHSVSFGELRPRREENSEVIWSYSHRFEIAENKIDGDKKRPAVKTYTFTFYLDKKMRVKGADGAFID
jgi:hypothetical protein